MSNEVSSSSSTAYNSLIPVSSPLDSSWFYPISTSKEKTTFKIQSPAPSLKRASFKWETADLAYFLSSTAS